MNRHLARGAVSDDRPRWWAFVGLCLGMFMTGVNATIVYAALPSIKLDLHFSDHSLVWVMNAYLATFGGFVLLGGRMGDIFGNRGVFLLGAMLFTLASLASGLAMSHEMLVAARSIQGSGGAILSAVALSQVASLFPEPGLRAKALGIYVFLSTSGTATGMLLGGALTSSLGWRSIFYFNALIGIVVLLLCLAVVPRSISTLQRRLDLAGALTATAASMLAVGAIVNGSQFGWTAIQTLALLLGSVLLIAIFVLIEARVARPLMPLALLRTRNLVVANVAGALWSAAVLAGSFVSALYLQRVRGFNSLWGALAFLPANLVMAVVSLGVAPMLVMRFGRTWPLVLGMSLGALSLALFPRVPLSGNAMVDVLPGMLLLGLGMGMAYNPLLLSALDGIAPEDSGAASGLITTSLAVGGALGLSIIASTAAARTRDLLASGDDLTFALNGGYQLAFYLGAAFAALAALISGVFLRSPQLVPPEVSGSRLARR